MRLRESVREGCEGLIWKFFETGGQVVIYDANNGTRRARKDLAEKFDKAGIHVILLGAFPAPSASAIASVKRILMLACDSFQRALAITRRSSKLTSGASRFLLPMCVSPECSC